MQLIKILCGILCVIRLSAIDLRTAAQLGEPKYFARQGSTEVIGICIDVMRAIEKIEPSIKFSGDQVFVPFNRIEIGLEDGTYDVFVGFARNDERKDEFNYTNNPIYIVRDLLAVKNGDNVVIANLEDIKKVKGLNTVLVAMGVVQADNLKREGYNVDDGAQTVVKNIEKLIDGRGRFIYHSEYTLKAAIMNQNAQNKVKILPISFNESGRYIAFSKKVPKGTIDLVDGAISTLRTRGELKKIIFKYTDWMHNFN